MATNAGIELNDALKNPTLTVPFATINQNIIKALDDLAQTFKASTSSTNNPYLRVD